MNSLLKLASSAVEASLSAANYHSGLELPRESVHAIYWKDSVGQLFSISEAVDNLYRDSLFPAIVDLAVRGVLENKTLFLWIPSGHEWVTSLEDSWNEEYGPFKPMGLMLPSRARKEKLTLNLMKELGEDWLRSC